MTQDIVAQRKRDDEMFDAGFRDGFAQAIEMAANVARKAACINPECRDRVSEYIAVQIEGLVRRESTGSRGPAGLEVGSIPTGAHFAPPVSCPFCGDADFDLFGLKLHLQNNWCKQFSECTEPRDGRDTELG